MAGDGNDRKGSAGGKEEAGRSPARGGGQVPADVGRDDDRGLLAPMRRFLRVVDEVFGGSGGEAYPELTYRQVVSYLVAHQPPGAVRGALLRRPAGRVWAFHAMFLDEQGEPVERRLGGGMVSHTFVAADCDEELHDLFGDKDLIIFA